MKPHATILVVDDKENMRALFRRILPGYDVITAESGVAALAILGTEDVVDVVVSDIRMPGMDGLMLLREMKRLRPDLEVVLMTAFGKVEDAIRAMKGGAFDYLLKPFDPDEAVLVIEKALEVHRLRRQAKNLQDALDRAYGYGRFIGESMEMRHIYKLLDRAAASDISVLILGESGTGKELAARTIHDKSARRDQAFIPVNCGALPAMIAESELFGHVRGAFTGAHAAKSGLFEEARDGTIFLDEINSLPLPLQVKLNRALEEREARRVGANRAYKVNVRILAASNVDLKTEVDAGKFRQDLYFRLNVFTISLPPLREHTNDIPLLAGHFLKILGDSSSAKAISSDVLKAFLQYSWPGNVRELRNAVESALAVADGEELTLSDLPVQITNVPADAMPDGYLAQLTYQEVCELGRDRMVRQYCMALLKTYRGNVTASAEKAGIERETLHRLLRRHGIDPMQFRK